MGNIPRLAGQDQPLIPRISNKNNKFILLKFIRVNYVARAWVKSGDYWSVVFDATEAVKKKFDAEGISIPFPQRDVHIYEHKAA